ELLLAWEHPSSGKDVKHRHPSTCRQVKMSNIGIRAPVVRHPSTCRQVKMSNLGIRAPVVKEKLQNLAIRAPVVRSVAMDNLITFLLLTALLSCSVRAAYYQYETNPSYWHNLAFDELNAARQELPKGVAKNVIFFLGDGMGIPTVTAARILAGQLAGNSGEENKLSFDKFPYTGLSRTYNVDRQITDSAASGTAYLTGVKTNQGLLGLSGAAHRFNCTSSQNAHVDSILRWSISAGKSTGVLTTTRITHATPAASYSHSADRDWESDSYPNSNSFTTLSSLQGSLVPCLKELFPCGQIPADQKHCEDIALQLITRNNDINVIMGGGRAYFYPTGFNDPDPDPTFSTSRNSRTDGRNLVQEWEAIMSQKNVSHHYVYNKPGLDQVDPSTTDYLLGLFKQGHMSYELDRDAAKEPSLAEMTEKAIKILQKNSKGYFLFVEGGKIDHGHHESRAAQALHDTISFADAIDTANRLTNKSDTLIVVTADHSHVMNVAGYASRGNPILGLSDGDNHVPTKANDGKPYTTILYADGPGYHSPRQIVTNADTVDKTYISQSAVPLYSETHGGEDVGIYAQGPQSFLYTGVHEQNYIPIVMAYASCVGPFAEGQKQKKFIKKFNELHGKIYFYNVLQSIDKNYKCGFKLL
ncbi:hypothetical protein Btru_018116, partial [Bulinus truncatus]